MKHSVFILVVFGILLFPCYATGFETATPLTDCSADTWSISVVPGGDDHEYPSIAVRSDGVLCMVSVCFSGDGNLQYWEFDGSSWTSEAVGTESLWSGSLALDSEGNPFVAAFNPDTKGIKLLERTSPGIWSSEEIYDVGNGCYGQHVCLAIDSQDHLHVSSEIAGDEKIVYLHFNGLQWTVKDDFGDYHYPDLTVDSNGDPRISYILNNSLLCCQVYTQGQWWTDVIGDGSSSSIAVDTLDQTAIASFGSGGLSLFTDVGPGWLTDVIDPSSNLAHQDLQRSPSGELFVAYHESYNDDLRFALQSGSGWEERIIDWQGLTGFYPSTASDGEGHYYIAYSEIGSNDNFLKLAYFGPISFIGSEESAENQLAVSIFPNPTSSRSTVSFSLPEPDQANITVFTVDGRLVSESFSSCEAGENSVLTDDLSSGIYILRINACGLSAVQRLTVLR